MIEYLGTLEQWRPSVTTHDKSIVPSINQKRGNQDDLQADKAYSKSTLLVIASSNATPNTESYCDSRALIRGYFRLLCFPAPPSLFCTTARSHTK